MPQRKKTRTITVCQDETCGRCIRCGNNALCKELCGYQMVFMGVITGEISIKKGADGTWGFYIARHIGGYNSPDSVIYNVMKLLQAEKERKVQKGMHA